LALWYVKSRNLHHDLTTGAIFFAKGGLNSEQEQSKWTFGIALRIQLIRNIKRSLISFPNRKNIMDTSVTHPKQALNQKAVLLVEDHPIYAEGMCSLLASLPVKVHVTCVGTIDKGLTHVQKQRFDLILLDLSLSDGTGHSFLNAIEPGPSYTPIIIISGTDDRSAVDQALSLGACGYLSKATSSGHLRSRLLEYLTQGQANSGQNELLPCKPEALIMITIRQRKVLDCMADGMANKEIARTLFISENTVKYHVKVLFGLLAARSRTECLKQASRLGLIG